MRRLLLFISFTFFLKYSNGQIPDHHFDPPWNHPRDTGLNFTVPGVDNVPDLYGDIINPQLVIFFAGNQFMVVDDLVAAFKKKYPQYKRIFVETLPPGVLAKQIQHGSITIGNLTIELGADIYTAGKNSIDEMNHLFSRTELYAKNYLAIMVQKGNPKNIRGLKDLAGIDVRVSMPNPEWEGIGKQIEQAYLKTGGEKLRATIMQTKVKNSTTFLTQIHHRQTPMRILYGQSDAGPVWFSECYYQQILGHPVETVDIPPVENITVSYVAGILKNSPHQQAASDFMDFLTSDMTKNIYKRFGFQTQ